MPTFFQLYHLLSVYRSLKAPLYGNCSANDTFSEEAPKIILQQFKKIFDKKSNKSFRRKQLDGMIKKLEKYVDVNEDISNLIQIDDLMSKDINDCIIYYLCGFICQRITKDTKCIHCKNAFKSHEEICWNCRFDK